MSTVIIDYGMGNLISVKRAFEECGANVSISDNPEDLLGASHIVLPGVGAFTDGMASLARNGWINAIRQAADNGEASILGICLGMQLLADFGEEGGGMEGLGLIPGRVVRLQPAQSDERIPHVGWNELSIEQTHNLLYGIPNHSDFYFVHSYHFKAEHPSDVLATTPYSGGFTSVVSRNQVMGVQFHPEKSQRTGFQLIKNFLNQ